MEDIVRTTKHGILISDEIKDLPLILEYINHFPRTKIYERFDCLIVEVDEFNASEWFIDKCGNNYWEDILLDYINDDGRQRWRNYSNKTGIAFKFRGCLNSLRSIINAVEMYDKPKLYWYYID